jgi:transposase
MPRPYSLDLRRRIIASCRQGIAYRQVSDVYGVSASCAVKLAARARQTGSLEPDTLGRPPGSGKLEPYRDFLIDTVTARPDITMPELAARLEEVHAVVAHPASLSRFLRKAGFTYKKTLIASERQRSDVARKRHSWIHRRQPIMREMAHRLVFIDETSTNTKFTRLRGRATRGARLPGAVPHGHWTNQTFIAGLRCSGLTAPWIILGAMDRDAFDVYIETQLAPTLSPGDVVILDNLKVHDSATARAVLARHGAWFLFLPPYSPDLNPIEMAFAKLKAHLRAAGARTYEALWRAVGNICELFEPKECWNFFRHAGYVST